MTPPRKPTSPRNPTLQSLLARGYFPRELPPPFTTQDFAAYAVNHTGNWPARRTQCVSHNLARPGGLRRPLSIPNPPAFYRLADLLVSNWATIRTHTWRSRMSASRPYVMIQSPREIIPRFRYGELPRLRALTRRGGRYLLCTDISQFYPSLYTHSIPWALHGKAASKAALATRSRGSGRFGNKVDAELQRINHGQTNGIPIGPDTSLVVAELVLSAVDAVLQREAVLTSGFRYVDDYELVFPTQSAAEEALAVIQNALNDFGLVLNPRKTFIQELPRSLNNRWAIDLSRFPIRGADRPVAQRDDLVSLFSIAFDVFSTDPESTALQYALARVRDVQIRKHTWPTFQNCLLNAATADAATLRWVLDVVVAQSAAGHSIDKKAFADVCSSIIRRHAPQGHGSEVSWALWGCLALDVPLSEAMSHLISRMDDDVVALLALQCEDRAVLPSGSLDRQFWTTAVATPDAAVSDHWLLAYEGHVNGWLPNPSLATDPIFGPMLKAGVVFFDSKRCTLQSLGAALQFPGGQLTHGYA